MNRLTADPRRGLVARMRLARALPGLLLAVALSCSGGGTTENLLAGKPPARADGAPNALLITDGQTAGEGADWNAPAACLLQSERASVEYDLGRSVPIDAAYVQGDNNDEYVVAVSEDGTSFRDLWIAPPVAAPGQRARSADGLAGKGRWIRLTARGGDRVYSVTELQVWSRRPSPFPPRPAAASPELRAAAVRTQLVYLVLAFAVALFATRAGWPARRTALLWLLPAVAAALAARAVAAAWPLGGREVSFARASAAAIVLLALVRGWDRARRAPPHAKSVVAACAFGAVLAFACFYNFGRPQFWHQGERRPMFVHASDMRIYQPFVKYFDELRYDGVYLASVLAFAEDERGGSLASLAGTRIRDLRDYRLRPVGELTAEIAEVRRHFTPERWEAFKRDLRFFRSAIGTDFVTTLDDHGANAPPSWVMVTRLFLGHVTASEATLTAAGLIDGLLFLAIAWAMWASFGLRPMLVAMTVFGATELYMFGTNWAGATLRHDWLALLAFAACALRRQRWLLAGALLGVGTMLRVLPAIGLVGVAAPGVAWLAGQIWRRRRLPGVREILAQHGPALRVLGAAAATMFVTFLVTGALYGFSAWSEWAAQIARYNRDLGVNEVNLRMLVSGVDAQAIALMQQRLPLYVLAEIGAVVVVVLAARERPLDEAMLLALPLVFVLLHPVNYHGHLIFLLVLLGARQGLLASAAPLLVMCVGGYWAVQDPDAVRRFELMTVLLFAALGWLYFVQIRARPAD
jgi:hypothetical protein